MQRLGYLVLALVATLSVSLIVFPSGTHLFPSISDANAAAVSMVLTGCVNTSGSCINVGWNGTTSKPNPIITVAQGDVVSIRLSTGDAISHQFQLDVDNDGGEATDCGTVDPCSNPVPPTTTFTFTVMANPGTYTYYCTFHTLQMHGMFIVNPSATVGGVATPPANHAWLADYFAIASIVLVGLVSAAVYFLHARRKNSGS